MSDRPLRSGQVTHAAGVNVTTLRYYERRGLLDEPDRTLGGHRLYPPETVTMLRIIKAAQRLGFTLEEDTLRAALTAGCDDLRSCAGSPCCPLPFTEMAVVAQQPGRPPEPRRWVG